MEVTRNILTQSLWMNFQKVMVMIVLGITQNIMLVFHGYSEQFVNGIFDMLQHSTMHQIK